jgi:predicted Zn-dependent peptidase
MLHGIQKLSNGLTVIHHYVPSVQSVAINILVKVGSRYETPEFNGVSHFLEHMAFKGTKTRSAKDIAEQFDAIGGYLNAYTGRETTAYVAKVLNDDLDKALDIMSDVLLNSTFEPQEVEREREVIAQEIAQTLDTPDEYVFEEFQELAFPNQSIGRSILGTHQTISTFTQDTFNNYISHHYYASNMVIALVGNVSFDHAFKLAEKYFSQLPSDGKTQLEQAQYVGGTKCLNRDLEQVQLVLGFKGVSHNDDLIYPLHILVSILGGGMSSRLFQEVREKRGLAYSVGAFSNCYSDTGLWGIYAGTSSIHLLELFAILKTELNKIANDKVSDDELTRIKQQCKASMLIGQESTSACAEDLARHYIQYGRYVSVEEILDKLHQVDSKALIDLAQQLLNQKTGITCAVLGDYKGEQQVADYARSIYG